MRPFRSEFLVALLALLPATVSLAQSAELTGLARATGDKHPLSCIRVALTDSTGREVAFARTDWRGLFAIAAPRAGVYRLRFESPMTLPVLGPVDTVSDSAYVERVYELPFALNDSSVDATAAPRDPALRPLVGPAPHYPDRLRSRNTEGSVLAEFVIDSSGAVDTASIRVVRATQPEFGAAVKEALGKWIFRSPYDHGVAVCERRLQPFEFRMSR